MLACFYLFAAYDPVAYEGNVLVAIAGRGLGALAMGLAAAWRILRCGDFTCWPPATLSSPWRMPRSICRCGRWSPIRGERLKRNTARFTELLDRQAARMREILEEAGELAMLARNGIWALLIRPPYEWRLWVAQAEQIGVRSLGVASITTHLHRHGAGAPDRAQPARARRQVLHRLAWFRSRSAGSSGRCWWL